MRVRGMLRFAPFHIIRATGTLNLLETIIFESYIQLVVTNALRTSIHLAMKRHSSTSSVAKAYMRMSSVVAELI